MIVRAVRADREDVAAGLDQQDFLVADMTQQLAVGKLRQLDAAGEIRAFGCIILLHGNYLRC